MKTLTTTALILMCQTALTAADWRKADAYAHCLKNESARVCREIYVGMRGEPNFVPVYKTAYELYTLSSHLLDTIHEREDMDHVWRDLETVDEQFHDLEAALTRVGWCGPRPGTCPLTRSQDFHRRRLEAHVRVFDDGLHKLISEVDYVPTPDNPAQPPVVLPPPVPNNAPTRILPRTGSSVYPSRSYGRARQVSVPIGRSGFRLNLVLR